MTELVPCTGCHRHVAVDELACPFCGIARTPQAAQTFARARLSRAAVFVAGAALASCGGTKSPPKDTHTQVTGDAGVANDPANPAPVDAGRRPEPERHQGGGGCNPTCMPYGAPPARRRLV